MTYFLKVKMCGEASAPPQAIDPSTLKRMVTPVLAPGDRQTHGHQGTLVEDGARHLQTHLRAGCGIQTGPMTLNKVTRRGPVCPQVGTW